MAGKIRGFDSPDLYRKDALIRIKNLEVETWERAKVIKEMESKPLRAARGSEEDDDECE